MVKPLDVFPNQFFRMNVQMALTLHILIIMYDFRLKATLHKVRRLFGYHDVEVN